MPHLASETTDPFSLSTREAYSLEKSHFTRTKSTSTQLSFSPSCLHSQCSYLQLPASASVSAASAKNIRLIAAETEMSICAEVEDTFFFVYLFAVKFS